MTPETISELTQMFEGHAQTTDSGIEFWLARDLQVLLGYADWRNFQKVIEKAKQACEASGHEVKNHFVDTNKMVEIGSGTQRNIKDVMLTRYASYLVAQNGDPAKEPIAFAQTYFALQTRRSELIQERLEQSERLAAREELKGVEKDLSAVIYEVTGEGKHFGYIRSRGDEALMGQETWRIKASWNVPDNRPLADFAPTILLKAKSLAAEITVFNTKHHQLSSADAICGEHVTNNSAVRQTLIDRGIRPESLSPEEDVKKVERRLRSQDKRSLGKPEGLGGGA